MLNRSQLMTLFGINRRGQGPISRVPRDIRQHLVMTGNRYFNSASDIAALLHHIAYGNLAGAKKMLDANPGLVLQAGNTETPSGLKVLRSTPLECALGAGDPEMAEMIAPYFDKFNGGEKVRDDQYARYRQHIDDMLNAEKNPPYDFTLLIETLLAATPQDITAALNLDFNHESVLRDVLAQFRKDFTPGINTGGMHFNYLHLLRAFEVYDQYYDALMKNCGDNDYDKYDKYDYLRLFSRQVIGFIQRGMPAIDRMVFAQGLHAVVYDKANIRRSFKFKYEEADFPITADDSACSGLGYEYHAAVGCSSELWGGGGLIILAVAHLRSAIIWKTYVEQKLQTCRTYAATPIHKL